MFLYPFHVSNHAMALFIFDVIDIYKILYKSFTILIIANIYMENIFDWFTSSFRTSFIDGITTIKIKTTIIYL